MREAYTFSVTVSGPTHGVFMSVVSDQYMDAVYCWKNGVSDALLVSGVDPAGTRSSHERPSRSAALKLFDALASCASGARASVVTSYDESPISHQMHPTLRMARAHRTGEAARGGAAREGGERHAASGATASSDVWSRVSRVSRESRVARRSGEAAKRRSGEATKQRSGEASGRMLPLGRTSGQP